MVSNSRKVFCSSFKALPYLRGMGYNRPEAITRVGVEPTRLGPGFVIRYVYQFRHLAYLQEYCRGLPVRAISV